MTVRQPARPSAASDTADSPEATQKVSARFRLRVDASGVMAIGPGKVSLLEAIAETGSLSAGARKLGMSYRRAWLLVDELNRLLRQPAVDSATGGQQGGGSHLTPMGEEVVRLYRAIEARAQRACAEELGQLEALLAS